MSSLKRQFMVVASHYCSWPFVRRVYGIATYDFDDREVVINGGLQFALRENLFLSGAAGIPLLRADTNPNQYITYLGVQWTF